MVPEEVPEEEPSEDEKSEAPETPKADVDEDDCECREPNPPEDWWELPLDEVEKHLLAYAEKD